MSTDITKLTPYHLARLAECGDPDGVDSPGADFLAAVARDLDDLRERLAEGEELSDVVHELADSSVPIYTHQRWQAFVDLAAYEEDVTDILGEGAGKDLTETAGVALYMIAERLLHALAAVEDDDES